MRERVIHRTGLWAGLSALLAALLLAIALTPQANAQGGPPPPPPTWFWGLDFNSVNGADIAAIDADDDVIISARISGGQWSLQVPIEHSNVKFRITDGDEIRETASQTTETGRLRQLRLSDFTIVEAEEPEEIEEEAATVGVRVRARVSPSDGPGRGRVEFGASLADGDPVTPNARYWPTSVSHNRWLRSSPIDLGDGVVVRVIARVSDEDGAGRGRIEFGLYVDGVDAPTAEYNSGASQPMFLPPARYFPEPRPSHNRWLRSSIVQVPVSR